MRLSFRSIVGYGAGGIADAANFTMMGSYMLFFLTGVADISPAAAGVITGAGTIISSLWGPVVGYLSDHSASRFGRRRFFLMLAAPPLLLSLLLCFTVVSGGEGMRVLYYGFMVALFWCAFSTFYCPWLALGAEYTGDYNERTRLRSITYAITQLGCIFGMAVPPLLTAFLSERGASTARAWQLTALCVGLMGGAALQVTIRVSQSRERLNAAAAAESGPAPSASLRALFLEYWEVLKLRPTRYIIAACLFHMTAQSVFFSDRVYFFTYNIALSSQMMTVMMLLFPVFSVLMVPLVLRLSAVMDKRRELIVLLLVSAVLCVGGKLLGIRSAVGAAAAMLVFSVGNAAFWQLMPVMLYDICEYDEYQNGKRREGIVVSLQNVMETICTGLSSLVLGVILQLTGYVEGASQQSAAAQAGIEFSFILLPAILMTLCALMVYRYPITRENFDRLRREIEERKRTSADDRP